MDYDPLNMEDLSKELKNISDTNIVPDAPAIDVTDQSASQPNIVKGSKTLPGPSIDPKDAVTAEPEVREVPKVAKTLTHPSPVRLTKRDRTMGKLDKALNLFKTAPIGSLDHIRGLREVTQTMLELPEFATYNKILAFFKDNKDEVFLQEHSALQRIATVEESIRTKMEIMYVLMRKISLNNFSKKTVNIPYLITIFPHDSFNVWITELLRRKKGTKRR